MGQALAPDAPGIRRRGEVAQDVLVEEVGERPVPDVMQQPGQPQRLHDQPLRGRLRARLRRSQGRPQAGIKVAGPQPCLVHDAQAVREAAVLGRREDPTSALQLADATHPLDPRRVEQVAFGRRFGRQAEPTRAFRREALRQLDVAVDRIADEIDRPQQRMHLAIRRRTRAFSSCGPHRLVLHGPSLAETDHERIVMAPEVSGSCPSSWPHPSGGPPSRATSLHRPYRSAGCRPEPAPPCRKQQPCGLQWWPRNRS